MEYCEAPGEEDAAVSESWRRASMRSSLESVRRAAGGRLWSFGGIRKSESGFFAAISGNQRVCAVTEEEPDEGSGKNIAEEMHAEKDAGQGDA